MKVGDIVKSTVNPSGLLYGVYKIEGQIASVVLLDFNWLALKFGHNPSTFEVNTNLLRVVQ